MLYDPATNIKLGTSHLSVLMRKYPEVVRALAAYNAGESRVEKWATKTGAAYPEVFTERILFVETRDYVRTILRNRAYYQALYQW
jgi:soluble lytic murein transglycosylase